MRTVLGISCFAIPIIDMFQDLNLSYNYYVLRTFYLFHGKNFIEPSN